jgi:hypothetical protein
LLIAPKQAYFENDWRVCILGYARFDEGLARRMALGRKRKLTPHQKRREAIKRRDVDEETLRSIARSYNVSPQTISRLGP